MLYNTSQQLLQSNDKLTNQYRLTREPSEPDTSYTTKRDSTASCRLGDRLEVRFGHLGPGLPGPAACLEGARRLALEACQAREAMLRFACRGCPPDEAGASYCGVTRCH